jgi:hypothetical protein
MASAERGGKQTYIPLRKLHCLRDLALLPTLTCVRRVSSITCYIHHFRDVGIDDTSDAFIFSVPYSVPSPEDSPVPNRSS